MFGGQLNESVASNSSCQLNIQRQDALELVAYYCSETQTRHTCANTDRSQESRGVKGVDEVSREREFHAFGDIEALQPA